MKNIYFPFTAILAFLFISTYGQTNKIEVFQIGTKVNFIMNSCGQNLPETQGKLHFCDAAGNLGYVENSTGLNDRSVNFMIQNHYNEDEIYFTPSGISIRKENGEWENIPKIAIPIRRSNGDLVTDATQLQGGVRLPNGKLLFGAQSTSTSNSNVYIYDFDTKSISSVSLNKISAPAEFIYNEAADLTYILSYMGSTKHLSIYKNGVVISTEEIQSSFNIAYSNRRDSFYYNGKIYIGTPQGLAVLDVTTRVFKLINASSTPSLTYNNAFNITLDTVTKNVWVINTDANNGAISKFDLLKDSIYNYTIPTVANNQVNYKFQKLAVNNDKGWLVASNFDGLLSFNANPTSLTLTEIPKSEIVTLGLPYSYAPNNVFFLNEKFYFTSISYSSGVDKNYEVLIHDNETNLWSGRSDGQKGNRSFEMNRRFEFSIPDTLGGIWWFNPSDNLVLYRSNKEKEYLVTVNYGLFSSALGTNEKPLMTTSISPNGLSLIDTSGVTLIEPKISSASTITPYKDQVWIHSGDRKKLYVIKENVLAKEYALDNSFNTFYKIGLDSSGVVWFFKSTGSESTLRKFNPNTESFTDFNEAGVGTPLEVVTGPAGTVVFLGTTGLIFYNGTDFETYPYSGVVNLAKVQTAVFDQKGTLYCLQNDPAKIISVEGLGSEVITGNVNIILEGVNTLLPALDFYRPSSLSIDKYGAIWTNASLASIKIVDKDTTPQFRLLGTTPLITSLDKQEQVSTENLVHIYPNPSSDKVSVTTNFKEFTLSITDMKGQLISTFTSPEFFSVEDLANGFYLLKIVNGQTTITEKLIKN